MPIYEFICLDCGNQFEKLQSFSDTTVPRCPQCQSERVQKRLSPPAVHFKGSGWYVTDSKKSVKNASSKGDADTNGATETASTPSETAKTESTSKTEGASKSETKAATKEPAG
jgi:putative FmdB family regulatory protein